MAIRTIMRYPIGSEDERHPVAGWWLDCDCGPSDGYPEGSEVQFGPFETMQDAVDFRDATIQ